MSRSSSGPAPSSQEWRATASSSTTALRNISVSECTAAVIAIIANQVVARYKARVGRRIQSATLLADARHSWLDAISSFGALVGLIGVAVGWTRADAVAGLVVTLFIAHVGYEVTGDLLKHLMDGVDNDVISQAESAALEVPGVVAATARARWTGRQLRVQVLAILDPHTELADADHVGRHVELAVHDRASRSEAGRGHPNGGVRHSVNGACRSPDPTPSANDRSAVMASRRDFRSRR